MAFKKVLSRYSSSHIGEVHNPLVNCSWLIVHGSWLIGVPHDSKKRYKLNSYYHGNSTVCLEGCDKTVHFPIPNH